MNYDVSFYQKSADFLRSVVTDAPEIGIVLGSSLGPFADRIEDPVTVDYADIPNFLRATAPGHAGKLIFGKVAGRRVVCMSGRFHSYEGYDFEQLALPMRVFKLLGVEKVLLTNAAGAVNESYRAGDVVIVTDHIKLNGASPLRGKNIDEFGPRFFDVSDMYTASLRSLARKCAEKSTLRVHEGVYFFMPGPQFETPAEIRAIRILGGDVVGMSTVTEAITAAHCGMEVLCLAVVTNMAAGVLPQKLTTDEVNEAGRRIAEPFSAFVRSIIAGM